MREQAPSRDQPNLVGESENVGPSVGGTCVAGQCCSSIVLFLFISFRTVIVNDLSSLQVDKLGESLLQAALLTRQRTQQVYLHRDSVERPAMIRGNAWDCYPVVPARAATGPNASTTTHNWDFLDLARVLHGTPEYTPLHLHVGNFLPVDKIERRKYISILKGTALVDRPFVLFYYHQGGQKPTLFWVWKCANGQTSTELAERNASVGESIVATFPLLASREEERQMRLLMDEVLAFCFGFRLLLDICFACCLLSLLAFAACFRCLLPVCFGFHLHLGFCFRSPLAFAACFRYLLPVCFGFR